MIKVKMYKFQQNIFKVIQDNCNMTKNGAVCQHWTFK